MYAIPSCARILSVLSNFPRSDTYIQLFGTNFGEFRENDRVDVDNNNMFARRVELPSPPLKTI